MDWKVPGRCQQELKAGSPEKSGFERSSLGGSRSLRTGHAFVHGVCADQLQKGQTPGTSQGSWPRQLSSGPKAAPCRA